MDHYVIKCELAVVYYSHHMAEIQDVRMRDVVGIVATISGEKFISGCHRNTVCFIKPCRRCAKFRTFRKFMDVRMKINSF